MKFIRILFFISGFAVLIASGFFTYSYLNDGFSIRQMSSSLSYNPQYNVSVSEEKKEEMQALLDQNFYYLSKGCQFYVFENAEGTVVLKFFKHKHLRPLTWLNALAVTAKLQAFLDTKIVRRNERIDQLFSSCLLAYQKMPEETGLFFVHLNRRPLFGKNVTIVDKLGFKHTIAIDDHEYILQKRAETLKELFAHIPEEKVPEVTQKLTDLVLARCQKGICDKDTAFVQNVAYLEAEGRAIFMDIGQFREEPSIFDSEEQKRDLDLRLHKLFIWTSGEYPHLLPYVLLRNQ